MFDAAGNLFVVDVAWGRILRLDGSGEFTVVVDYDGEPNGLAVAADGRIFIADHQRGLLVVNPSDEVPQPSTIVDHFEGRPFLGLNDLVFDVRGELWFTDQGSTGLHDPSGRVFRLDTDGALHLVLDNVPSPNGLARDSQRDVLYVAVTRDNAVWRVPLRPDLTPTKVGRFIRLSGGVGPDGMYLDDDGNLFVAHLGLGVVWIFDSFGLPTHCLQSPSGRATTNVTMQPGTRRIYVTESETSSILSVDLAAVVQ